MVAHFWQWLDLASYPGHLDQQQLCDRWHGHHPGWQRARRRPGFFGTEAQITRTAFTANAASGGVATNGTSGTGIGGGISVEGGRSSSQTATWLKT